MIRGLHFVLKVCWLSIAFCVVARAAMAEEPRCTKDALKAAFGELWPAPPALPNWGDTEIAPWSITPSCGCCGDNGIYLTLEAYPWGHSPGNACTDSAAYHECKAKAARERDAALEAAGKARAEREARLNALARACELPGFEPPKEPEADEWVTFNLLDGDSASTLQLGGDAEQMCLALSEGQKCCLEITDAGELKCAPSLEPGEVVKP